MNSLAYGTSYYSYLTVMTMDLYMATLTPVKISGSALRDPV